VTWVADLTGKVALVTGASSGLGLHFARALARAGAAVVLAGRRLDALHSTAEEISSRGVRTLPLSLDVLDRVSIRAAVAAAAGQFGHVDILVNNAGITSTGTVLEQTEEQWDAVLGTNLKGAFLVSTEVARHMRQTHRSGAIINIASILGLRQAAQVAPYATSKAGLIQLTRVMALELARFAIRVNALAPGYIDTDLNREFWTSEAGAALIKRIPQRRLGIPQDLEGALLLLASDASRYMTGSVITVDGGHTVSTL